MKSGDPSVRAIWAVLARYGTTEGHADHAIGFIAARLSAGQTLAQAGAAWDREAERRGYRDLVLLGIARENSRRMFGD